MNNQLQTSDAMQTNLGFVQSQTAHVETEVYKHRFPQIRYPGLIPIDTSAPEWIKTVDYYSMDISGSAGWTADRARDLNLVGTELGKASSTVHMADIGYDYGIEEVNQASMLGTSLSGEKASVARLIYERTVDNIAFTGNKEKGFQGLFNHTGVTVTAAPVGDWSTATPMQILADVNALISAVFVDTNEIAIADTLILPSLKFQHVASVPLNNNTTKTILDFIKDSNHYTAETGQQLNIRSSRGLNKAGVNGTSRAVAYRNSKEVLKMHIPMRHRFLPVQVVGLTYQVPGIFRLGGLDIRLPREVHYMDGI